MRTRFLIPALALTLAACTHVEAQPDPLERARSAAAVQIEACIANDDRAACATAAKMVRRTKCWADMDARSRGARHPIRCSLDYLDDI